jgi:RimJ/RimL family protein N-acetyltransferase
MPRMNEFGQPIGPPLADWRPPPRPHVAPAVGRYCRLEPIDTTLHAEPLFDAIHDGPASLWTYLPFAHPATVEQLATLLDFINDPPDAQMHVIISDERTVGFAAYLDIDETHGVVEIGAIMFAPALQRTAAATEAIYMLIDHAVSVGYRRVGWKCDELHATSRRAADRFGFTFEGTFRKATHYSGRSRDTAWYSIIDDDWAPLRHAFQRWLAPDNFDAQGTQITALQDMRTARID